MSELNDISDEIRKAIAYHINVINNPENRPFSSFRCTSCKLRVFLKNEQAYGKVQVELGFSVPLLLIQSLDLHLQGKFVNGLPAKTGKLGKMFISKQDNANGLQQK